jgi:hypothetical protein
MWLWCGGGGGGGGDGIAGAQVRKTVPLEELHKQTKSQCAIVCTEFAALTVLKAEGRERALAPWL